MAREKRLKLYKLVSDPAGIEPDCVYLIKPPGQPGFDIKVSDSGGTLYPLNCCNGDGGGTPGDTTGRPYKAYTVKLRQMNAEPPMVTEELENEYGINIMFEYQETGRYYGMVAGAPSGRLLAFCNAVSMDGQPLASAVQAESTESFMLCCGQDNSNIVLELRFYE